MTAAIERVSKSRPADLELPELTVGVVNILAASENAQRIEAGIVKAGEALGWEVQTVDAGGVGTRCAAAMEAFIDSNVDAIIDLSCPTGAINQALARARQAGIPVVQTGGEQDPNENLLAQYVNDDEEMASRLAEHALTVLPKNAEIAIYSAPILRGPRLRTETFTEEITPLDASVVTREVDLANLASSVGTTTNALLQSNPQLGAIFADLDGVPAIVTPILRGQGRCSDVRVFGFYDNKQTLAAIREGCVTAVVTEPPVMGWAAMDQFAQLFSRDLPLDAVASGWAELDEEFGIQLQDGPSTQIVDATNAPPEGEYLAPYYDYERFFTSVWANQFGSSYPS